MFRTILGRSGLSAVIPIAIIIAAGGWVLLAGKEMRPDVKASSRLAQRRPTGVLKLVSVEPLPEMGLDGEMCEWVPASSRSRLVAFLHQERSAPPAASATAGESRTSVTLERPAVRTIRDLFPTFTAVAVDVQNNEIVLQDENLFQIMVYDRLTDTPLTATMSEPKRVISGPKTDVEFNCGVYVDPRTGDIYSVSNDTLRNVTVFSRNASGNVRPQRQLSVPIRTYGIAVSEANEELFLTVQGPPMVLVHNKYAEGRAKPLRVLTGNSTGLADPHGIGLDTKNGLLLVSNYGNAADYRDGGVLPRRDHDMVPGSGRYEPPSISVYPIQASGDTPPLRTIQGARTQLNWPSHLSVDEEHGEVYVANDGDDSILVFRVTDRGNVAPIRVLKGPNTQIKNPSGVFVDAVNDELVVSNMGNHRATVYGRTASGDAAPIRTIRTAPEGKPALMIANPGAVAYDTKRDQIIVPN
ncbi:MAG: hypothetical protein HYX72_09660 [Acidobacteria bacterium]|nr:hypothetical protein [Acidobacteriota bacterium]